MGQASFSDDFKGIAGCQSTERGHLLAKVRSGPGSVSILSGTPGSSEAIRETRGHRQCAASEDDPDLKAGTKALRPGRRPELPPPGRSLSFGMRMAQLRRRGRGSVVVDMSSGRSREARSASHWSNGGNRFIGSRPAQLPQGLNGAIQIARPIARWRSLVLMLAVPGAGWPGSPNFPAQDKRTIEAYEA